MLKHGKSFSITVPGKPIPKPMVAAGHEDCPLGCTLQPVNRNNFNGDKE